MGKSELGFVSPKGMFNFITPVIFALNLKKPLVFHHTYQKQKQPKNEEGIKSVISFELPGITWQYLFRAKERLQTHHFY